MPADLWALYRQMLFCRRFEEAVARLWSAGLILGEMHLAAGEEAVAAGVVAHLKDGDAMALDARGTPELLLRGADPVAVLRELLGRPDGLCAGRGGHMHLFAPALGAASSGIVGASGPAALGFALAGQMLRPGMVAVAFFGDGALNQGMLMEAFNLAAAWKLPVLFVCKDNGWAITTDTQNVTGGTPAGRARGFGLAVFEANGSDVLAVWEQAGAAIERARAGGPAFLHARVPRLAGHFLGDALTRSATQPLREGLPQTLPALRSALRPRGARPRERLAALGALLGMVRRQRQAGDSSRDPLVWARRRLAADVAAEPALDGLEADVAGQVERIVAEALAETPAQGAESR